jgi:hypothetical protein
MENFFDWIMKPISKEEVLNWFNANNMNVEKIDLFYDIFFSLSLLIDKTYLGNDVKIMTIELTNEDKKSHFDWCWGKTISNFGKEGIRINEVGEHRDYLETFFWETFYAYQDEKIKNSIKDFIKNTFNLDKSFSKSDLDVLTEIYHLMERNTTFLLTTD